MRVAHHYTELRVWQLADDVRHRTYAFTKRSTFQRDTRLREQTDDAIESVCRNIAEGFAGSHKEFRRYLSETASGTGGSAAGGASMSDRVNPHRHSST